MTGLLSFFYFLLYTASAAHDFKFQTPVVERLSNELEVAWFEDRALPLVDLSLTVRSGHQDDPKGKSGLFELLASVLSQDVSQKRASADSVLLGDLGATHYVTSDDDSVTIGIHGLASDYEALLSVFSDLILKPIFTDAIITQEKRRLQTRWTQIAASAPELASLAYHRAVMGGTPYARGSISSMSELISITLEDIKAAYQTHFVPANTTLVVAGAFPKEITRRGVTGAFGSWSGPPPKKEPFTSTHPVARLSTREKGIFIDTPGEPLAQIRIGYLVASPMLEGRYEFLVANALLGGGASNSLLQALRDKEQLAFTIGSTLAYSRDAGVFAIGASTLPSKTGALITKVRELLRTFSTSTQSTETVESVKRKILGSAPIGLGATHLIASRWVAGSVLGLGPEYLNEMAEKISAVRPEGVLSVFKSVIERNRQVIVVAGDPIKTIPSLKAAGIWPLKRVKASEMVR